MKLVSKPTPDAIAEIKAELADYDAQRQNAQQQLAAWRDKLMMAEGAHQACAALLQKLDIQTLAAVSLPPQEKTDPAS